MHNIDPHWIDMMGRMQYVLIEDEYQAADMASQAIEEIDTNASITWYPSANDFLEDLQSLGTNPPDLFVVDVMVRSSSLREGDPGLSKALKLNLGDSDEGVRCVLEARKDVRLAKIPVVFYTVLEASEIASGMAAANGRHVRKGSGFSERLQDAIRQSLGTV